MNSDKAFGKVLAAIRKKKGISQEALADICSLDRTTVSLYERGVRQPTLPSLLTLAKGLKIPASEIIAEVEKEIGK